MSEDDLKAVLAKYQQKSFELFNQNIVLETQVEQLNKKITSLTKEIQSLSSKQKRTAKQEESF
jgi:hypothetical protein